MVKTAEVLSSLWVDSKRMAENMTAMKGLHMAEKVMLELVEKGLPRNEAHEVLREASMQAAAAGEELIDICSRSPAIAARFSGEELEAMFDPVSHLGVAGELVDEAVSLAREAISNSP